MANKRKKSYKRDTAAMDRAESRLAEHHSGGYDDIDTNDTLSAVIADTVSHVKPKEPVKSEKSDGLVFEEKTVSLKHHAAEEKPVKAEAAAAPGKAEEGETLAYVLAHASEEKKPEPVKEEKTETAVKKAAASESGTHSEDKPKKSEKEKKKKKEPSVKPLKPLFSVANIVYSAIVFAVVTVAFLALPRDEVSITEQRKLAEFPTFSYQKLMNGEYTNGITDYFNDNVPYRDTLKNVAVMIRSLFGVSYDDAEIVGPVAVVTEEEEPVPAETEPVQTTTVTTVPTDTKKPVSHTEETTTVTTTAETTTKPVATEKNVNEIAEGVVTNGQVVTKLSDGHWWGISLYGGGKGTTYANALNRFKEELGDSVNVYSMPVPTSGEYYLPDKYAQYNASHQKSIDAIDAQLKDVISVPASMALWEHINELIYLRTDHHWQPLGAYYAAKCFCETAGVKFADISTMERVDIPGYMGTMYSFTESSNLLNDPEVFTYYKPTNSYTTYYYDTAYNFDYQLPFFIKMPASGSYSTFMGGDKKIVRIKPDAGTGRKLVIFKDSYGNAEIPFYFGSFDEVYVCDMRYFDLNGVEFVKFTGATDLLFTMCTFSAVGTNANGLEKILNNPVTEIKESVS